MSSTNRGAERNESDYYITPQAEIDKFLAAMYTLQPDFLDGVILDPSAGGDEKTEMPYPNVLVQNCVDPQNIITLDIREDSRAAYKGVDYLTFDIADTAHTIITNPPFSLAEQFVKKALQDVQDGGFVAMLVRLNFFGSERRRCTMWANGMMPKWAVVHSKRMSFRPDGKTDSIEYMHAVWQRGWNAEYAMTVVV